MRLLSSQYVKYHLSKPCDRFRIACHGLKCEEDSRGKGRIWLCDLSEVSEVSRHLAKRDKLPDATYICWSVNTIHFETDVKRSGRKGIYFCTIDIRPVHLIMEGAVQVFSLEKELSELIACS